MLPKQADETRFPAATADIQPCYPELLRVAVCDEAVNELVASAQVVVRGKVHAKLVDIPDSKPQATVLPLNPVVVRGLLGPRPCALLRSHRCHL